MSRLDPKIAAQAGPNRERRSRNERMLIVNADDIGLSREVTDGIIWAIRHGIVTSTSFMANMPDSEYALEQLRGLEAMPSVGIHFNLSQGRPLSGASAVTTLVDESGNFLAPAKVFRKAVRFGYRTSEIRNEFEAQCRFMIERGFEPTHADLHHFPFPQVVKAAMATASRFGIRSFRTYRNRLFVDSGLPRRFDLRLKCSVGNVRLLPKRVYYSTLNSLAALVFGLNTPDSRLSEARMLTDRSLNRLQTIQRLFANCPVGVNEWVCHPGFSSKQSNEDDPMNSVRESDLEIVCSADLPEVLRRNDVRLTRH